MRGVRILLGELHRQHGRVTRVHVHGHLMPECLDPSLEKKERYKGNKD